MVRIIKNKITDTYSSILGKTLKLKSTHITLTILDFKNERECNSILKKIQMMLQ